MAVYEVKSKDVKALVKPEYEEFSEIGRCLHLDAFVGTVSEEFFRFSETKVERLKGKEVLWFMPRMKPEEHNRYGNVTFVAKWADVLSHFGKIFEIDQLQWKDLIITRVFLAKKNYQDDLKLKPIDKSAVPSALKESDSKYEYATESDGKKHELHIAIEVDDDDCKWLLKKCKVEPNNHSEVNKLYKGERESSNRYISWQCYKYNNKEVQCLFPYKKEFYYPKSEDDNSQNLTEDLRGKFKSQVKIQDQQF